jgi:hypothetical protein
MVTFLTETRTWPTVWPPAEGGVVVAVVVVSETAVRSVAIELADPVPGGRPSHEERRATIARKTDRLRGVRMIG